MAELAGQLFGFAVQAAVGDADGAVAGDEMAGVAEPVALECVVVAVVFAAVELDDQAGGGPEDVDLVVKDEDVGGRRRQAVLLAEGSEPLLERGSGFGRGSELGKEATDRAQRVTTATAPADLFELTDLQQPRRSDSSRIRFKRS